MPTAERFGMYLRGLREKLPERLTQGQLAKRLDLDSSYICKIEKGKKSPTPDLLLRLAPELRVDKTLLLIEAGYIELPGLRYEDLSRPDEEQLRILWAALTAEDRKEFLLHARYLLVRRLFETAVIAETVQQV